jgi:hypothetical protein
MPNAPASQPVDLADAITDFFHDPAWPWKPRQEVYAAFAAFSLHNQARILIRICRRRPVYMSRETYRRALQAREVAREVLSRAKI